MERVLVTGAAGFLGWNLVEYLLSHDFFVEAVVRPNSPSNVRLLPHPHLRIMPLAMEDIVHLLPNRVTMLYIWHGMHVVWTLLRSVRVLPPHWIWSKYWGRLAAAVSSASAHRRSTV